LHNLPRYSDLLVQVALVMEAARRVTVIEANAAPLFIRRLDDLLKSSTGH